MHRNGFGRKLNTNTLRERKQRRLRCAVATDDREIRKRRDGDNIDNRRAISSFKHRHERANHVECAEVVCIHIALNQIERTVENTRERGNTRVVDQYSDIPSRIGGCCDLFFVRNIQYERNDPRVAKIRQLLGVTCASIDFADALLKKCFNNSEANTTVRAGNEYSFSRKVHGVLQFMLRVRRRHGVPL